MKNQTNLSNEQIQVIASLSGAALGLIGRAILVKKGYVKSFWFPFGMKLKK